MPIPGEQPDLTALPPESSPVKRRLAAQYVREARDRLTSSSGTRPAFDYELLRQYAQNRLSASLVMLLLVATIGFLSSLWTGAVDVYKRQALARALVYCLALGALAARTSALRSPSRPGSNSRATRRE